MKESLKGLLRTVAYTDGSYSSKENVYSAGVVIIINDSYMVEYRGVGNDPTYLESKNATGEILAAAYAIKVALEIGANVININHDFKGVADWADPSKVFGKKRHRRRLARDYCKLILYARQQGLYISFNRVQAHSGDIMNERAHRLATDAITDFRNGGNYDESLGLLSSKSLGLGTDQK